MSDINQIQQANLNEMQQLRFELERDVARDIAEQLTSLISKYLQYDGDKKDKNIKLFFQMLDKKEHPTRLKYTNVFFMENLHPVVDKAFVKEKCKHKPDEFVLLLIIEGIVSALDKKNIKESEIVKGLAQNSGKFTEYLESFKKELVPDDLAASASTLSSTISSELGLPTKHEGDIKCEVRDLLTEIWKQYDGILKEILKESPRLSNAQLIREFVSRIPQQTIRTGFSPEIFSQGAKKYPFYAKYVLEEFSGERAWNSFLNKVKYDFDKNLRQETKAVFKEWIEYNILTNLEFYFSGGPTQGDSITIIVPIRRYGEDFGVLCLCLNKDQELTGFDAHSETIARKTVNLLVSVLPAYVEKYDRFLMDIFLGKARSSCLNRMLDGQDIRFDSHMSDISKMLTELHNEELLICLDPITEQTAFPCPRRKEFPKELESIWEGRWGRVKKEMFIYYRSLQAVKERIRNHGIRTAIAAIMARNMSHLLGSHIEPGIKNDIESFLLEILESPIIADISQKPDATAKFLPDIKKQIKELKTEEMLSDLIKFNMNTEENRKSIEKIIIKGIFDRMKKNPISDEDDCEILTKKLKLLDTINTAFNKILRPRIEFLNSLISINDKALKRYSTYRQRRMDFIARIATMWPQWGFGFDFYLFYVLPFETNSILLHFIGYSNQISISSINFEVMINNREVQEESHKDNKKLRPVDLSIVQGRVEVRTKRKDFSPLIVWGRGGDMGIQAFHIILENIIRNSIKHSSSLRQDRKLGIFISVYETYAILEREVDWSACKKPCRLENKQDNLYIVVACDADDKNLVPMLDDKLCGLLVDDSAQVKPEDWGIKEIKIAAAFLANKKALESNSLNPDYIQVGLWRTRGRPAYCFTIPRYFYMEVFDGVPK